MALPGWYPDPGGVRGQFRYWNGSQWSSQTTADPASTPAPAIPGAGPGPGSGKKSRGPLIGIITAVVLLALVLGFWLRHNNNSGGAATVDTNTSTPTVSAWNESSTPQASKQSAIPVPSGGDLVNCPDDTDKPALSHPADKTYMYGGHLRAERISDWDDDTTFVRWAYDQASQYYVVVPGWESAQAVGALVKGQSFTTPQQAAFGFMSCFATSSSYLGYTGRTDMVSSAITIDGKPGWWLRSEVRVNFTDPRIQGDVVDVIVLDTGDPAMFSFWEGNATIGDTATQGLVDHVRQNLHVQS